ncbi:NADH-quinone oxidoreductase subunit D [Pectinatus cerevisiiphilus]|uniref:NADH-quinone oxidoreductase subunit D n=1 Tax=Pectinatus cerevisiiphilus TaxID=86956 RepID=A0A4R3K902_9FIRM|nr:NADH-quinone oxidoreductase subunit D [Pectinatus cerevisiiphilus]TCS79369.1 NADH-quinone oxidoreductase subunit D [Pectinatus cerevisiiphilus]
MIKTETYQLSMGPVHPSTHGVLQVLLTLDGEKVIKAVPCMGYLHRGIEKLMEQRTYFQCLPYTDRLDYVSAMNNNFSYCHAVEKLAAIEVPEKAQYLRVIMAELNRIASHMIFIGSLAVDIGATTGMIYPFRDRERILDIFNELCGARMTYSYIRIGGVKNDLSAKIIDMINHFLSALPSMLDEYNDLLTGNEFFQHRLKGTSLLSAEQALHLGVTGPMLRASGVNYDLRKENTYSSYDDFDFSIPLGKTGDNLDRYIVRMQEITESAKIIRQALDGLPEGEFTAKVPRVLRPPKGEIYDTLEGPRGEVGYHIVSDGSAKPYRIHIRRPSFINLQALDTMCRGYLVGDVVVAMSTIDPILGEVDC